MNGTLDFTRLMKGLSLDEQISLLGYYQKMICKGIQHFYVTRDKYGSVLGVRPWNKAEAAPTEAEPLPTDHRFYFLVEDGYARSFAEEVWVRGQSPKTAIKKGEYFFVVDGYGYIFTEEKNVSVEV